MYMQRTDATKKLIIPDNIVLDIELKATEENFRKFDKVNIQDK